MAVFAGLLGSVLCAPHMRSPAGLLRSTRVSNDDPQPVQSCNSLTHLARFVCHVLPVCSVLQHLSSWSITFSGGWEELGWERGVGVGWMREEGGEGERRGWFFVGDCFFSERRVLEEGVGEEGGWRCGEEERGGMGERGERDWGGGVEWEKRMGDDGRIGRMGNGRREGGRRRERRRRRRAEGDWRRGGEEEGGDNIMRPTASDILLPPLPPKPDQSKQVRVKF